ncbi:PLP-dependent aminotransferase family protein [Steroidobacter flavus]|uniref:PLP-dependent aminotransferase family protein n=1 Tax=Steroidobacter flavus TaxID=1842136 RepID=A0ABV8T2U2_9GAMM
MSFVIPLLNDREPLSRQIYLGFRQAILRDELRGDERLPSTRELAEHLDVSRTVVVLAYEQLLAERFVHGRSGSGTYVTAGLASVRPNLRASRAKVRLSRFGRGVAEAARQIDIPAGRATSPRYDFAYGRSDIELFPFEAWRRLLLKHARKAPVRELDYAPAGGSEALREALAAHLRRSRAVLCDPSQVIVVSGSQQALDLIARVLVERGDRVAMENPCYQGAREVLRSIGARLLPVSVDTDGLNPASLPERARIAFVTPSHQFPTGAILPLARRLALLDWARRADALVVEDDYDGEFRYEEQPLQSLQGLDTDGRVIYIGTFSRTIFPALRIGYLIVPKSLTAVFTSAKWLCDRHTATLEQETLAEFISSGMYERHLRRVRRRNAARRKAMLEAIDRHLGNRVQVTGYGAGAHVVLWSDRRIAETAVLEAAASRGVGIYGISPYFLGKPSRSGFMLGYSRMKEADIREGIRRLRHVL